MARPTPRRRASLCVEALETRVMPSTSVPLPLPTLPTSAGSAQIAELAYAGTPADAAQAQVFQDGVGPVVSDASNQAAIAAAAPGTPQLTYTNLSSLYGSLLTDWLAYAEPNGLNPEDPFYHVTQPTPFTGTSPSSQPVTWFWGVYRSLPTWTNLTSKANGSAAGGVAFAAVGDALYVGYPQQFREIDINLASAAAAGWSATLQYPTAVGSNGNPTAWGTITTLTNTTAGLTQSGQITFDPPANWQPASVDGSARLYYVRFQTTTAGTAPVANTILGADYVNAHGTNSGVIPVFDYAADTNHDGYLNDAEYAQAVAIGDYARFAYQSRLFAPGYGQMRFATDPGNVSFQRWAANYEVRYLQSEPLAAGLFMDNSAAIAPATSTQVVEEISNYSSDYAALLYAVGQAIAPHWIMANIGNAGSTADPVVAAVPAVFEESVLQPLAANTVQFEALAARLAHQESLRSPAPYLVLDSAPTGGSPTDPRTQLATLAEYYLLATPGTTLLDFYGGSSPASSWSQHWSPAAAYNIGRPTGSWSVAASGADPANASLTYTVFARAYSNALVLYKPLSYGNGVTGTLADGTATTINLGGTYYVLQANGTLGPAVTSITLRNGEGAILVKTPPNAVVGFVLSGLPSSATAGQVVTFTIKAVDAFGNVATGYLGTVHLRSTDPQAVLPADYTFTAADQGAHTFTVTLKTAGPQILLADDTARPTTAGSAGLVVNPAAVTHFALSVAAPVTAGQPATVTVTALDAFNNPVPTYQGTVHFTSTDAAAVLPSDYTFLAADLGKRTFTVTLKTRGTQTLLVTDKATASVAGSLPVTVN